MFNNDDWIILNKKINTLKENMSKYERENKVDEMELRECILDVLSWFEIFVKEDNFNDLISGFRHINNKKKHTREIYNYSLTTKGLYPSDNVFPSSKTYPAQLKVTWCQLDEDEERPNQWENYQKKLAGKNILDTIDLLLIDLKNHYKIK